MTGLVQRKDYQPGALELVPALTVSRCINQDLTAGILITIISSENWNPLSQSSNIEYKTSEVALKDLVLLFILEMRKPKTRFSQTHKIPPWYHLSIPSACLYLCLLISMFLSLKSGFACGIPWFTALIATPLCCY